MIDSPFNRALPIPSGAPDWFGAHRQGAAERFLAAELPSEDDDDWRYGRINDLDLSRFAPLVPDDEGTAAPEDPAILSFLSEPAALVRTVDGRVTSIEKGEALVSEGVVLSSVRAGERPGGFGSLVAESPDAFTELADAFFDDATLLQVPKGARITSPIVIAHVVRPGREKVAVFPRTLVSLGESAEARVIEVVVSSDGELLVVPVTELLVGENATLTYYGIQELGENAWQLGYQLSKVERSGRLSSFAAALGGDYARLCTRSSLVGDGAESELLAVYFANGHQVEDFRTFQDHVAPRTRSNLVFKGAVTDNARSVYTGLIHMAHGAKKADAAQTNRNLVLSKGAHADSVPNLDIDENDVRCSHASAVGPVDPEEIFYLESRGVPPETAERLLLLGFFEDLLAKVTERGCGEYLRGVIGKALSASFDDLVGAREKASL